MAYNTKELLVMKFGGASLQSSERLLNMGELLQKYKDQPLVLVVSAMGKTTNALEYLSEAAVSGSLSTLENLWQELHNSHYDTVASMIPTESAAATLAILDQLFTELRRLLEGLILLGTAPDRVFDRILAMGELMSSAIVAGYLQSLGWPVQLVDATKLIHTDLQHRNAEVLWHVTGPAIENEFIPLLNKGYIPLTQGFIGQGTDGYTTTLGREGSDYTASMIASALKAKRLVIWKDVPGVMSADPRWLSHAQVLPSLTYEQAVEMTFYGATVIHPKTIRPLRNAAIPLQVRSFIQPETEGTLIHEFSVSNTQPTWQFRFDLVLLKLQPLDLSFIDEQQIQHILQTVEKMGLRTYLMQRSSVSFHFCMDFQKDALQELVSVLREYYQIAEERELVLVSHMNPRHEPDVNSIEMKLIQQLQNQKFSLMTRTGFNQWRKLMELNMPIIIQTCTS